MSIHSRIKERRIALGLVSHKSLAELLGVSWQTVQLWEKEGGTAPNRNRLPKVAGVLKCSVEWLTTGRADPAPQVVRQSKPATAVADVTNSTTVSPRDEPNHREVERTALHRLTPDEERLLEMYRLSFEEGQEKIIFSAERTKKRSHVGVVSNQAKNRNS